VLLVLNQLIELGICNTSLAFFLSASYFAAFLFLAIRESLNRVSTLITTFIPLPTTHYFTSLIASGNGPILRSASLVLGTHFTNRSVIDQHVKFLLCLLLTQFSNRRISIVAFWSIILRIFNRSNIAGRKSSGILLDLVYSLAYGLAFRKIRCDWSTCRFWWWWWL